MLLHQKLKEVKIVLASGSPRRKELLSDLNLKFGTLTTNVEETYASDLKAEEISEFLARKKADSITLEQNTIYITSDTIVWQNDKALEKPENESEARKMLMDLSDSTHQVISSVGITSKEKQVIFSQKTLVKFAAISVEEIDFYIETYKPFDKAGSYGIQEWIGKIGIEKIEGCYYNVMGLPLNKLYHELLKF